MHIQSATSKHESSFTEMAPKRLQKLKQKKTTLARPAYAPILVESVCQASHGTQRYEPGLWRKPCRNTRRRVKKRVAKNNAACLPRGVCPAWWGRNALLRTPDQTWNAPRGPSQPAATDPGGLRDAPRAQRTSIAEDAEAPASMSRRHAAVATARRSGGAERHPARRRPQGRAHEAAIGRRRRRCCRSDRSGGRGRCNCRGRGGGGGGGGRE